MKTEFYVILHIKKFLSKEMILFLWIVQKILCQNICEFYE